MVGTTGDTNDLFIQVDWHRRGRCGARRLVVAQLPIVVSSTSPQAPQVSDKETEVSATTYSTNLCHIHLVRAAPMMGRAQSQPPIAAVTPGKGTAFSVPGKGVACTSGHPNCHLCRWQGNSCCSTPTTCTLPKLVITQRENTAGLCEEQAMSPSCCHLRHL